MAKNLLDHFLLRLVTNAEYDFTLILGGIAELTDEIANAVYAVCDDVQLDMSCCAAFLDFTRAAPTMKNAILSAIADVRKVGLGIDVLRVNGSTLLTQAEVARKLGKSRQAGSTAAAVAALAAFLYRPANPRLVPCGSGATLPRGSAGTTWPRRGCSKIPMPSTRSTVSWPITANASSMRGSSERFAR